MKRSWMKSLAFGILLLASIVTSLGGCRRIEPEPYMKMNPPADSDKPLPVPADDFSCWAHTAANMLAGAGYGTGTTVQDRARDIWNDMDAEYQQPDGSYNGGWIDAGLQWWLASPHNTWTNNPYTVVTVYGNKTRIPWAEPDGARDLGNELRSCNMVGVSISWPNGGALGGERGHAITSWGDNDRSGDPLLVNPGGIRVTDSDTDTGGDVQAYTYDAYTNPNPGGTNEGDGWYFNYDANHPFIKHITTLTPTETSSGDPNTVRVFGSYEIRQPCLDDAVDLHYVVGTDVEILTYRTWLSVPGTPAITESQPRWDLTVDWDLSGQPVAEGDVVTINTEFIEPSWNGMNYSDVHFTYAKEIVLCAVIADVRWMMETPYIDNAQRIPNVTGGYVIGSFELRNLESPEDPPAQYRLIHQYLYNQTPESHRILISGTNGFEVTNIKFGHSYGYLAAEELWEFKDWLTESRETYQLSGSEEQIGIVIDWKGLLPYPEGDEGLH